MPNSFILAGEIIEFLCRMNWEQVWYFSGNMACAALSSCDALIKSTTNQSGEKAKNQKKTKPKPKKQQKTREKRTSVWRNRIPKLWFSCVKVVDTVQIHILL
jgi:hypothetical protein